MAKKWPNLKIPSQTQLNFHVSVEQIKEKRVTQARVTFSDLLKISWTFDIQQICKENYQM